MKPSPLYQYGKAGKQTVRESPKYSLDSIDLRHVSPLLVAPLAGQVEA